MGEKIERKYLAHYVDANFITTPDTNSATNYVRLGQDLETFAEELNPQVEVRRNILGEQNVIHQGYQVQSTADPFYCYYDEPLFEKLAEIANDRENGDKCKTTRVDVLLAADGNVVWAYRENCWLVPNTVGGDTSGVQIPFQVLNCGSRVKGTWDITTKKFTPST